MKTLSVGSSLLEITCSIPNQLLEGQKIRLEEKIECGGGHAGNIAYLLGKWGVESYVASMLGADDTANKIKKEYEAIGVKTDYIETSYDKPTSQEIVIVNTTNKNKTILEILSNSHLKKYAFNIEPDIIIVDGYEFNATIQAFDKYPKAKSFLMVNYYNNEVLELCKYVSNIIVNRETAERITNLKVDFNNSGTLVDIYNRLKQKFPKAEIVLTLGERGCVYSISGQVKIMPPIKTNIVDTNGAGDAFVGSYVYAMGRDFGIEKSIAYATIAASLSVTKMTSRESIPSLTEVSGYYDSKFGAGNNPNQTNSQNNGQNSVPNNSNNSAPNMNTTETTNNPVPPISNGN